MPDDTTGSKAHCGDFSEAERALYEEEAFSDLRECPDCGKAKEHMRRAAHRKGDCKPQRRA